MSERAAKPKGKTAWARFFLAGPWTFAAAAVVMAAMAVWVPPGDAQVDNIVLPMVAFPAVWLVLFLAAYLDRNLVRAFVISVTVTAVNVALIVWHIGRTGAA